MASIAQGFTASEPNLTVTSISLGLGPASFGPQSVRVRIYPDASGIPNSGSPLYTSTNTVSVTTNDLYTWDFANANLVSGSTYWVMPDPLGTGVEWLYAGTYAAPTGQNASGFTYAGTLGAFAGPWGSTTQSYSISIVPEPSTWMTLVTGLLCGSLGLWRRARA